MEARVEELALAARERAAVVRVEDHDRLAGAPGLVELENIRVKRTPSRASRSSTGVSATGSP
jgi:hypothetical protein